MDEKIITLTDIKRLFLRTRKKIFPISLALAAAVFLGKILWISPQYEAKASFRESFEEEKDQGLLQSLARFGALSEPQTTTLMQTERVLKPLVEKLGLQASILHRGFLSRLRERILVHYGKEQEESKEFVFADVSYFEERGKTFQIRFLQKDAFEVFERKKKIAEGKLGEKIHLPGVSFTLVKTPSHITIKRNFPLQFSPWSSEVAKLKKKLKISPDKNTHRILHLTLSHPDRFLAAEILNGLMEEYQKYLKFEQEEFAEEQLSYLEKRQNELYGNVEKSLHEHVLYLQKNLGEKGFVGLDQEIESLLTPHQENLCKGYALDIEELHLEESKEDLPLVSEGPIAEELKRLAKERQQLKGEKGQIELALQNKMQNPPLFLSGKWHGIDLALSEVEREFSPRVQELQQEKDELMKKISERKSSFDMFEKMQESNQELYDLRKNIESVSLLLQDVENGSQPSSFTPLLGASSDLFKCWVDTISQKKEEQQKKDFSHYLKNYLRLLNIRESLLREKTYFPTMQKPPELEGIDLTQAKSLYHHYNSELDALYISMRHLELLQGEIKNPSFEMGSLSAVLQDPVSQELIKKASHLTLQQKDVENQSAKDQKRTEEELELIKKCLGEHLREMHRFKRVSSEIIQQKIHALQEVTLDLVNQQIALLKEETGDMVEMRKSNLQKEKSLLKRKREELKEEMAYIPEKWKLEKQLQLKTDMALKTMQATAHLVQAKTVGFHLQQIQSKPLDYARTPLAPKPPHLFLHAMLAFVLSSGALFAKEILRALFFGFPVSPSLLLAWRKKVLGEISSSCDGRELSALVEDDLETLRKISSFLLPSFEKGMSAALIGGKGPHYGFLLSELLAKKGVKVLLVDASFRSSILRDGSLGLLHYLEGGIDVCPLLKQGGYDYLPLGGHSRYGVEILGTARFLGLFAEFKKSYDAVLFYTKERASSEESKALLPLSDRAILTLCGETQEELIPYASWDSGKEKLGFIEIDSWKKGRERKF